MAASVVFHFVCLRVFFRHGTHPLAHDGGDSSGDDKGPGGFHGGSVQLDLYFRHHQNVSALCGFSRRALRLLVLLRDYDLLTGVPEAVRTGNEEADTGGHRENIVC